MLLWLKSQFVSRVPYFSVAHLLVLGHLASGILRLLQSKEREIRTKLSNVGREKEEEREEGKRGEGEREESDK